MKLTVAAAVSDAIAEGSPVVALESTLIAHGFPRPQNLDVGRAIEAAVADEGAVPATIGVLDGELVVGLSSAQLERMASGPVAKLNISNLPTSLAAGTSGATTVSATLRAASMAGISMMATGGIGGVHRNPPSDVSSDLTELSRWRGGIVSSGAKAFLDLGATLDFLEMAGVTVVGYRTDQFPAFYSRHSGLSLTDVVHSPAEAAAVVSATRLVAGGSVLVANPIPREAELDPAAVEAWTSEAIARADEAGITGPARSPFVLSALAEISSGETVTANAALATGNARLAAQIALEL